MPSTTLHTSPADELEDTAEADVETNVDVDASATAIPDHEVRRQEILAQVRRPDVLVKTTLKLAQENDTLRGALNAVRGQHEELRKEIRALSDPEHYLGVVTHVERNGTIRVDMHVAGMSPVRAEVHPEIDHDKLCVGTLGYLSKGRNCLVEISPRQPEWKDLGSFEELLEDGRVVVKQHDQPRVLMLAAGLQDVPLVKGDRIGFDDNCGLAFARLPAADRKHLFLETPEDDFAELGGLEDTIRAIKRAVEFTFKNPAIAQRYRLPRKRGILLSGPPGNGKTRLGRCTANYIRRISGLECRFQSVVGSEDYSMWLGGTEERLKERVAAAREIAKDGPCVIFIDEIDALGRRRGMDTGGGAPDRILSTLLGLLDDVQKSLENVILMGATNRADTLDPGLTRPGRLDLKLEVPRPNRRGAACILRTYLGGGLPLAAANVEELTGPLVSRIFSPRGEFAELARVKFNDGRQVSVAAKDLLSGAMLEHIVRRAAEEAAEREMLSGRPDGISGEDLARVLDDELASTTALLSPSNVKAYVQSIPQDAHPVNVTPVRGVRRGYVRGE